MRRQSGFTLIEVLVVIGISAALLSLAATAVRHYWFLSAVESAAEQTESGLRELQQKTVAASHPMVYGAWFKKDVTTAQWGVLQYDPKDPSISTDDVCTQLGASKSFSDGVIVKAVSFVAAGGSVQSKCTAVAPSGSSMVFFYARGSATAGEVSLYQKSIDETRTITVSGVTGRVARP